MSDDVEQPDPAAVFGCAVSLWQQCMKAAKGKNRVNLSECYNGGDEFMRVVMRIATRFEAWACDHISFDDLDDVWPYLMEEKFGVACVEAMGVENLAAFGDDDCLRVAMLMKLPVKPSDAFCIYTNTVFQGPIPAWRDENGLPVVYATVKEAQREIAEDCIERLRQFLAGERDFEDAISVDDYIVPVTRFADGSITDEGGRVFPNPNW